MRAFVEAELGTSRTGRMQVSIVSPAVPVLDAINELWGANNIYSKGSR